MWKQFMLAAYNEPLFNWKLILSGIDMEIFRSLYLNPAPGYTGVVRCFKHNSCSQYECQGLCIRDLSTGTNACCPHLFSGPKIPVNKNDLKRYSLSYHRFHAELCHLLGLKLSGTQIDEFFWELGIFKRGTARFLPVYISYYHTAGVLMERLQKMLSKPDMQFALVIYDYTMLSRQAMDELSKRCCIYVSMQELFSMQPDCSLKKLTDPAALFGICKDREKHSFPRCYPCEFGTKWHDIHIKLLDRQTLTIWKRKESCYAFSYAALGMVNRKNNKPNKSFTFLVSLLENELDRIPVPAKTTMHYTTLVQRKREINNALLAFFPGIDDGDPIIFEKSSNSYQLRFHVNKRE